MKEINLPLKVDKLEKPDKCFKKLRKENLKRISQNMAGQNVQNHFLSLKFCPATCLQHLKVLLASKYRETQKMTEKIKNYQKY